MRSNEVAPPSESVLGLSAGDRPSVFGAVVRAQDLDDLRIEHIARDVTIRSRPYAMIAGFVVYAACSLTTALHGHHLAFFALPLLILPLLFWRTRTIRREAAQEAGVSIDLATRIDRRVRLIGMHMREQDARRYLRQASAYGALPHELFAAYMKLGRDELAAEEKGAARRKTSKVAIAFWVFVMGISLVPMIAASFMGDLRVSAHNSSAADGSCTP